jgi:hypothetical protein
VKNAFASLGKSRDPASKVSSTRARAHVAELLASGMTMAQIAERAGVGQGTPYRVMTARRNSCITERLLLAVS